jgi:hypothetical protein
VKFYAQQMEVCIAEHFSLVGAETAQQLASLNNEIADCLMNVHEYSRYIKDGKHETRGLNATGTTHDKSLGWRGTLGASQAELTGSVNHCRRNPILDLCSGFWAVCLNVARLAELISAIFRPIPQRFIDVGPGVK